MAVAKLVPEQLRQAAATVEQRAASVEQAEAQLHQADLNVGYTEIRAPSDGFITKRNVQKGSYVTAGSLAQETDVESARAQLSSLESSLPQ